ncbi:bifunctional acetate--CoA ligase family protein/GNAT family N-acetyltransferase [Oscillatoria sp. FACHB-1406]|uniref:bifunctional acetate--CoA ligase family protein/GNAT family N-acetyltransferase n=1 Tax=Oscillatoria sp. FACHB-1406 TaxID=2692846 RepID=UPI001685D575|nr:bifunctional acetate--CoA ligase family protein/GNAT family N-acetyltransferase [Oscillatoria sp. FACHB-1406]MBD2576296.1 bifunctional acetate--CoA ligase family protein/GNAT family N-acetyltransferase [Oscillatoria sp. FACHB-1406]
MQSLTSSVSDPASDLLRSEHRPLDAIFAPKSVAVIGATERQGSVGRIVLWNLISNSFGGTVYPVNPKRHSVLGIKAYPSIAEIPEQVDLVAIAIPAASVPGTIQECVDAGVKGAIVLSAGFKEIGLQGVELERQIKEQLSRSSMRLIGPNCLGVINPIAGLNATFANAMPAPGNVGFISQSGALCSAILDWSFRENVGFSSFISIGSMLDVNWGDLIYYLGDDPNTHSIVIYMESIGDARSFLSAAREVALTKPIVVLKTGRTEAAAQAATSHTGALAGSDAVLDAAFRRCGVLRVDTISELFDIAEVLAKQPRPKGPRLTIITNAGGPGVLATDALLKDGGELAHLSEKSIASLNEQLPLFWSHHNPIDILGDADPDRYQKALEIAAKDPESDGLLVILTPQAMTDPTQTAQRLKTWVENQPSQRAKKPIIASWMGDTDINDGELLLNQAKIPTYRFPDTAARVFSYLWKYSYNLRGIYETPILASDREAEIGDPAGIRVAARAVVDTIIDRARQAGRTLLTEVESKQILAAYSIPVVPTSLAASEEEAVNCAEVLGYPVVLKLFSQTITHKTDVGGVQLNLVDAEAVRRAYQTIESSVAATVGTEHFLGVTVQPMVKLSGYELIIGSSLDPQFGSVLLFGSGGQLVEVFQDRAIALPPLTSTLARRLMEQTHIYKALQGTRGKPAVDLAALEQLLVRFSQLVAEQRWIKEIDINPLLASPVDSANPNPSSLLALDARIVLHDASLSEDKLPKLAIRPYPVQYVSQWKFDDGMEVTFRPIRPEDEPLIVRFHETLSEQSVYLRYFHLLKLSQRTAHERMTRICFVDYDREMAMVVDYKNPETGTHEILAAGRLSKLHGTREAEFAMMVSDRVQCRGLGTELLRRLLEMGRDEQLERVTAEILSDNLGMQHVCRKLGFEILPTQVPSVVKAAIEF